MNYQDTEQFARDVDESDPLASYRERFHVPADTVYFCGNSLGLQPKTARTMIEEELDDWQNMAVAAHLDGRRPWYSYHELFTLNAARIVGANPGEVVMMNSLTVNIHLMFVSFFRPEGTRTKILMEHPAFPSDIYAVRTHLRSRGLDPDESIVRIAPRYGEHVICIEDSEAILDERGREIALVWLPGVNFVTGQVFDMQAITVAAKQR